MPPSLHAAIPADNFLDLIRQIESGLPFTVLEDLASRSGLGTASIASTVGIPQRTLARRKATGRFRSDESERIVRFSRVFDLAAELFDGERPAALQWLSSARKALGGKPALACLATETGARAVENLIGRLEHGVFS